MIDNEPSPALFCIVEMAIGQNFGPRPNPVRCLKCGSWSGPGINSFAIAFNHYRQNYSNSSTRQGHRLSWYRSSNIFPLIKRNRKEGSACFGRSSVPTWSGHDRVQVGSRHIGILHPAIATTTAYWHTLNGRRPFTAPRPNLQLCA